MLSYCPRNICNVSAPLSCQFPCVLRHWTRVTCVWIAVCPWAQDIHICPLHTVIWIFELRNISCMILRILNYGILRLLLLWEILACEIFKCVISFFNSLNLCTIAFSWISFFDVSLTIIPKIRLLSLPMIKTWPTVPWKFAYVWLIFLATNSSSISSIGFPLVSMKYIICPFFINSALENQ